VDPEKLVDQMLERSGAKLIRDKKHRVYLLPNGGRFIRASTPSEYRGAWNNLSDLRKRLGVGMEKSEGEDVTTMAPTEVGSGDPKYSDRHTEVTETELVVDQVPKSGGFKERILAAIQQEAALKEQLFAEASLAEKRMNMLELLIPYADDPAMEGVLYGLIPPEEKKLAARKPVPKKSTTIPEPPNHIERATDITRRLVFAGTLTFNNPFTVNDLVDRMVGEATVSEGERQRIRSKVAGLMAKLFELDYVNKYRQGIGKAQTLWRKYEGDMSHVALGGKE
jgi:hypothetical protein